MNKLPTKQIYLLMVIIVGIIALSVYSTYALFTFESETSNIVNIHTPNSLTITENVYEYQQITIPANTVSTTDVDIYNNYDYDVCYSVWYKLINENIDESKIQIFQISNNNITSSGVLSSTENLRITIAVINDNEQDIKINIGIIGEKMETSSCSLNLSSDKKIISSTYESIENLNEHILKEKDNIKEEQEGYLTYKTINTVETYKSTDNIYISNKFNYKTELFTLEDFNVNIDDIIEKNLLQDNDIYLCKEDKQCNILYKISDIKKENNNDEIYYQITLSEKLIGYLGGNNGLRKVNNKDYIYYGDNPNNYVYFNCTNPNDTETCELWQILGLYYNEELKEYNTKIIKHDSIGTYQYDNTLENDIVWNKSTLYKYLNEKYDLKNNYSNYIENTNEKMQIVTLEDNKIISLQDTYEAKINIIDLYDYIYTTNCNINNIEQYSIECLKNNWLNNIELGNIWTNTIKEINIIDNDNLETEEEIITKTNYAYSVGNTILSNSLNQELDIRPVVSLKTRIVLVSGDGSFTNPYIIK